MTYFDDTEAVKALNNCDEKAIEWIYKKYLNRLRSYAAKIVRCMASAEDIVQDVFVKLWKERKTIHITESLQAYLHTCILNRCRDYLDYNKVRSEHVQSIIDNSEAFILLSDHDPLSILITKDTERIVNDTLDAFPEQCRKVFELWWKEGFKYDEISERLGISMGNIKSQINRARTKLRKTLEYQDK